MGEQVIDNREAFLFVGEGKISEDDLLELKVELEVDYHHPSGRNTNREAFGEADISSATVMNTKNRFMIGDPVPLSLERFLAISGQSNLADIQAAMKDYEFCPRQLICSFVPAPGYRFHDAYFEITLQTLPINATAPPLAVREQAMAYALFPEKSEDQIKHTTTTGGSLTFTLDGKLSSSVPFPSKSTEGSANVSYIEAFGSQSTQPGWRFTRTPFREISGEYTLLILVRKPKGTRVQASFSLTAHLQFLYGSTPLKKLLSLVMFFRRRGSSATITDPTVQLC